MANVLVIKNADFTANRVAVITLEGKPCTGIVLDESTITVVNDQPVTVGYSVTPSDTTDTIVWTSSDTSVAITNGNVITIVGIGSTTITATCGSYSDSLTLTADLYAAPDWCAGSGIVKTDQQNRSYLQIDRTIPGEGVSYSRICAMVDVNKSDYQIPVFNLNDVTDLSIRPIRIPNHTGRIHVSGTGLYNTSSTHQGVIVAFGSATETEYAAGKYPCVKGIDTEYIAVASNTVNGSVAVPENADCFIVSFRLKNSTAEGAVPADVAAACNISIHFLPPEEGQEET